MNGDTIITILFFGGFPAIFWLYSWTKRGKEVGGDSVRSTTESPLNSQLSFYAKHGALLILLVVYIVVFAGAVIFIRDYL